MRKLERILIYSILAILELYVFSINSGVESKATIHEEIRVRNLIVVDSEGREAIRLIANKNGGEITVYNEAGKDPVLISIDDDGWGFILIYDSKGFHVY